MAKPVNCILTYYTTLAHTMFSYLINYNTLINNGKAFHGIRMKDLQLVEFCWPHMEHLMILRKTVNNSFQPQHNQQLSWKSSCRHLTCTCMSNIHLSWKSTLISCGKWIFYYWFSRMEGTKTLAWKLKGITDHKKTYSCKEAIITKYLKLSLSFEMLNI